MFVTKEGNIVNSINALHEGQDWNEFLNENITIWKKTIQALGYHFIEQDDSLLPIWLKKPLPFNYENKKVKLFIPVSEYDSQFDNWMSNNILKEDLSIGYGKDLNWSPNFIPEQAYALEKKLLDWGKYNSKDVDYNLGEKGLIALKYFGSEIYEDLYEVGKSESDLTCRLFVKFIDNKKTLRRTL